MDSISNICKYHFLCFVTIMRVKVISGHQVKKSNQYTSGFRAAIHGFGSGFRKERENDDKTLKKHQNRSKNEFRKITAKSRNDVKSIFFTCFMSYLSYFLRYWLEISYTYSSAIAIQHVLLFLKCTYLYFEGENFENEKQMLNVLKNFGIFKILKLWDKSFVALLILSHVI